MRRFATVILPMKKPASKLTLIASMLAVAFAVMAPVAQAADDAEKAAKKAKKAAADLKKYDKNANGKLDPDEEAALKADVEKAKAEKKKKSGN
jgi:capsule polysaccharide export protein KpsE/RkpR